MISGSGHIHASNPLPVAARRHPLVREVDRQLARLGLTNTSAKDQPTLVIAVSGGADSTALLLASVALRTRTRRASMGFTPLAVHVHHHLRADADADGDALWTRQLCQRLQVVCRVEHVHPAGVPGNTYANARRLRYEALARVASEVGARAVLVAHHAEDQLETMLMAMCRGAGPRGLGGMCSARALGELRVLRPLLQTHKSACESMCRAAGIAWCEDASNRDVTRRRARLRRDVLPVLEELWPGAARRAAKAARLMRETPRSD